MSSDYDDILYVIEKAVDQHAKLQRKSEASIVVTRGQFPFTVRVDVRYRGSRKRPQTIHEYGDTPEEAAEKLIGQLDIWAAALK